MIGKSHEFQRNNISLSVLGSPRTSVLTTATQELQLHQTQPALKLKPLNCIWSIPVSLLDPTHTKYPLLFLDLLNTPHFWNVGMVPWILPAIQVQSSLGHLACRAESLDFQGSTMHRSSQGSSRTPWQTTANGTLRRAELWTGALQSKARLCQLQCYTVLHCKLQLSLSLKQT